MIEFSGALSSKCIKFYIIKEFLRFLIIFLLTALPFAIPMLVVSIVEKLLFWGILAGIILVLAVTMSIIESNIFLKKKLPTQVIISDERIEKISSLEPINNPINEVETVADYGDWYQIYFNIGFRNNYVICQKNLLAKGTIEKFEKLFEEKMIRKC